MASPVPVIAGVPTSIAAFIGRAPSGPVNVPTTVAAYADFQRVFGGRASGLPMTYAVEDFFANGGSQAVVVRLGEAGSAATGLSALDAVDLFNTLVIVPDPLLRGDADSIAIYRAAAPYCAKRRAVLIADPLDAWLDAATKNHYDRILAADFGIDDVASRRSVCTYFPRVRKLDPEHGNSEATFSASGMIAGVFARSDALNGVWKAPAGVDARLAGITGLELNLTDQQNGTIDAAGINALRDLPKIGPAIWGSRTLAGADGLADDYKYLPVRRLVDFVEESISRGTAFAAFEPNADPLWATVRLAIGTMLTDLERRGAFYGFFVRCDTTTMTQADIDNGVVNVVVGLAPVRPAEYIILSIQQLAGKPPG